MIMDPFLLIKGLAMGIILSVTIPSASFWLVHVGFKENWRLANTAGLGLACGHAFLAMIVGYCLYLVIEFWVYLAVPARMFTVLILAYLAWKAFGAKRLESLTPPEETFMPRGNAQLIQQTFYVLVTMPMRVPAVFAYMVATAILYRMGHASGLLFLGAGVFLGALSWNGFLCLLGRVSAPRVEDAIIRKSLNKLNRFAGYVYAILLMITLIPLLSMAP